MAEEQDYNRVVVGVKVGNGNWTTTTIIVVAYFFFAYLPDNMPSILYIFHLNLTTTL